MKVAAIVDVDLAFAVQANIESYIVVAVTGILEMYVKAFMPFDLRNDELLRSPLPRCLSEAA